MKLKKRSLSIAGAIVAVGALTLAGCSSNGGGAADPGDGPDYDGLDLSAEIQDELTALYDAAIESGDTEVMIYAGHHDEFTAIYEGFENRFPGLTVTTASYVGAELQSTLEAERETGRHVGTVLSNPNGDRFVDQGFTEPFVPPTYSVNPELTDRIDASQLSDADGNYHSPWALMFNISYNTDMIDEADLPATWADLASAAWADDLTFMNPSTPGGTMTILTQLINGGVLSEDDVTALGANAKIVATDQLALQGISSGEFPVQPLAATTSIVNAARNGAPVASYFLPENNVIATEKWILLDNAPAIDAGKLFLSYLHTIDAQENALASGNFPINQHESLESPHGWPALHDVDFLPLKGQAELRPKMAELTPLFQTLTTE